MYSYDGDGIRTSKIVNGVKHTYTLNGSQIVSEEWGTNLCVYLYDESGSPIGMQYRASSMAVGTFYTFFFEKNLQGDIIAVYDLEGDKILTYTYDAWGNVTSTWYSAVGSDLYAMYNPFKYRGCYQDTETGYYYLQSRYYNPQWGRFLNEDSYLSTGTGLIGYNMYAYCNNNPIIYSDFTGNSLCFAFEYYFSVDATIEAVPQAATPSTPISIPNIGTIPVDFPIVIDTPIAKDIVTSPPLIDGEVSPSRITPKEKYDPNPYRRPGEKKQNRENRNKARKSSDWKPRNNRRDGKPAKVPRHTPGKTHKKYHSIYSQIEIF